MKKKYIWLCGENLGRTASNNSFYFWDHLVSKKEVEDSLDLYFVLDKTKELSRFVSSLPKNKQNKVVWKNSVKHYRLYEKADLLIVTYSYQDVVPNCRNDKRKAMLTTAPVVYLQHGTLGMKEISYCENSYNGMLFKFLYYNKEILPRIIGEGKLKKHQCLYGIFHPRYKELVNRNRQYLDEKNNGRGGRILWFLTWRSYLSAPDSNNTLLESILDVLRSNTLNDYLREKNIQLEIVCHQMMAEEFLTDATRQQGNAITIKLFNEVDLLDLIARSSMLITDYSSIAYDFAFLEKPIVLYQPDYEIYSKERSFYYPESIESISVHTPEQLVDVIVNNKCEVSSFFRAAYPEVIDYDAVCDGMYIDRLFQYLFEAQKNKITFIGYGFWGKGGTVSATKALAEALAEKGFLVQLLSLKSTEKKSPAARNLAPGGIQYRAFYCTKSGKSLREKMKKLIKSQYFFRSIQCDGNKQYLLPYAAFALSRYISNCNDGVLVSTRESFHAAVSQASNDINKVFFFHTDGRMLEEYFPGIGKQLQSVELSKTLFTTNNNYRIVNQMVNIPSYLVLGNCLESKNTLSRSELFLQWARKSKRSNEYLSDLPGNLCPNSINCVTLIRISKTRIDDIDSIISFGCYLKQSNINDVSINVYGIGDALEYFKRSISKYSLKHIINYCGFTDQPANIIRLYDLVIDFSHNQSFGMMNLESVFNGVFPLTAHNNGSDEIFAAYEDVFFDSQKELLSKIYASKEMTFDKFLELYNMLDSVYSREILADRFVEYVFQDNMPEFARFCDSPLLSDSMTLVLISYDPISMKASYIYCVEVWEESKRIKRKYCELPALDSVILAYHYGGKLAAIQELKRSIDIDVDDVITFSTQHSFERL